MVFRNGLHGREGQVVTLEQETAVDCEAGISQSPSRKGCIIAACALVPRSTSYTGKGENVLR